MHQQALVGQATDQIARRRRITISGDGRRGGEVERAHEDAEPAERDALGVGEQLMAPFDHGAHRPVTISGRARPTQQAQVVVKAREQSVEAE